MIFTNKLPVDTMIEMTAIRFWVGVTIAWLLLCILSFDQWFFFSPLGLMITFGIPIAGWALWWRYNPAAEQEISPGEKLAVNKSIDLVQRLKNRFLNQQ